MSTIYSNMILPTYTVRCPKCGGELWRSACESVRCAVCLWWGWLRDEQMSPLPSQADLTKALRDAEHEMGMAHWKRGYNAGYRAGQAELRRIFRETLGLDARYEKVPED